MLWSGRCLPGVCSCLLSPGMPAGVPRPFFTCQPRDKKCFTACGIDNFEHGSKLYLALQIHLTFNLWGSHVVKVNKQKEKRICYYHFFPFFGLSENQMCWRLKILPAWVILVALHALRVSCLTPSHPPVPVACIYSGLFTFNKAPHGESRGARWPQVGGMSTVWRGKCNQLRSAN